MKDKLQKKYSKYVLKPILQWYLKKDRTSVVNGFKLKVSASVFHPAYFFSSTYFSEFISKLDLQNKSFLDIGCGSGILALTAYKNGAHVTALDISSAAVIDTRENFSANFLNRRNEFTVIQSDLFTSVDEKKFDVIVVNPPYFFKAPQSDLEMAWNCGLNGEYFTELFSKLKDYCHNETQVYMILAENCDIAKIKQMAGENNITLNLKEEKKIKWENNFIYELRLNKV